MLCDDLGVPVELPRPPRRVVSLVPSLTEAIAASRPELLAGATDWCTHPPDLAVPRFRGTKNPDVKALIAAGPDLVVCNQEENRELDVQRLRAAGISVWVTRIETVTEAFASLRRLFTEPLAGDVPGWLTRAEDIWSAPPRFELSVVTAIWRDPWMVVGGRTFTSDLLARLGAGNPFAGAKRPQPDQGHQPDQPDQRYPRTDVAGIRGARPDLLLLPDEPYPFSPTDGPEAFTGLPTRLVSGRALTWYGPSLVSARTEIEAILG